MELIPYCIALRRVWLVLKGSLSLHNLSHSFFLKHQSFYFTQRTIFLEVEPFLLSPFSVFTVQFIRTEALGLNLKLTVYQAEGKAILATAETLWHGNEGIIADQHLPALGEQVDSLPSWGNSGSPVVPLDTIIGTEKEIDFQNLCLHHA